MFSQSKIFQKVIQNSFKIRCCSTKLFKDHKVVVTDNGSTFVAWHPEPSFPYECSKPLPEEIEEKSSSVLKTKLSPELLEIFKKKSPDQARQELMNITHTTKHRWFPRARDKKAKKTPMDRQYL